MWLPSQTLPTKGTKYGVKILHRKQLQPKSKIHSSAIYTRFAGPLSSNVYTGVTPVAIGCGHCFGIAGRCSERGSPTHRNMDDEVTESRYWTGMISLAISDQKNLYRGTRRAARNGQSTDIAQQAFYDPVNERMFEPDLTGFSYSFTDDGHYEEAYYRAIANRMSKSQMISLKASLPTELPYLVTN